MTKLFKYILPVAMAFILLMGLVPAGVSADPSTEHVSISLSPDELSQEGTVSVSITLRNTNQASSIDPAVGGFMPAETEPGETTVPTVAPTDSPDPTPTPTPAPVVDHTYSNISISNSYGVTFETAGVVIEAGGSRTFTSNMSVSSGMIGTTLSFTVTWSDGGTVRSETVTSMVKRANTPYLRVTRTANPAKATPGTKVRLDYTFTNTGSIRLVNITLVDRKVAGTSNPMTTPFSLDPGKSTTFTYEMTMGTSTVESSPQVTFYAYGSSTPLTVSVSTITIGLLTSQLTKEVVRGAATPEGVPFTIYLTNNGNQQLKNLVVKDELGNAVYGSGFSLAVGESKTLQAFIPNPSGERYVVFKITGTDAAGSAFTDNTESYVVRPYIDASQLKLKFTANTIDPLDSANNITVQFTLENLGSLPYRNLTLTEQSLGYTLHTWEQFESGASDTIKLDLTLDGERDLVFELSAEDTSGNPYKFEACMSATYANADDLVPYDKPTVPVDGQPTVNIIEDDLGKNVDGIIEKAGSGIKSMIDKVAIIAIVAGSVMLILGIIEIVIRRNNRSKGNKKKA